MVSGRTRWIIQYGVAVLAGGTGLFVRLVPIRSFGPGFPTFLFLCPAVTEARQPLPA
ncbi:MAG TPA: hypothetical protein VEU07_07565 [Candidatus Acidoferrum sp.]|nr:hypothetical protein [Candidatus Acidoferrum sp.]